LGRSETFIFCISFSHSLWGLGSREIRSILSLPKLGLGKEGVNILSLPKLGLGKQRVKILA